LIVFVVRGRKLLGRVDEETTFARDGWLRSLNGAVYVVVVSAGSEGGGRRGDALASFEFDREARFGEGRNGGSRSRQKGEREGGLIGSDLLLRSSLETVLDE
jgi:hypothetical protein